MTHDRVTSALASATRLPSHVQPPNHVHVPRSRSSVRRDSNKVLARKSHPHSRRLSVVSCASCSWWIWMPRECFKNYAHSLGRCNSSGLDESVSRAHTPFLAPWHAASASSSHTHRGIPATDALETRESGAHGERDGCPPHPHREEGSDSRVPVRTASQVTLRNGAFGA